MTTGTPTTICFDQVVWATDGFAGIVGDVVVDPMTGRIGQLVVQQRHHHGLARLVPFDLVDDRGEHLTVRRTRDELLGMELVNHVEVCGLGQAPHPSDGHDIGIQTAAAIPQSPALAPAADPMTTSTVISWDEIPGGHIELDRRCPVVTADGHVAGHLHGLVHDGTGRITAILVREGLLRHHHLVRVRADAVDTWRNGEVRLAVDREAMRADVPAAA